MNKILVINGSPKGDYSTTLHTARYLQLRFPQIEFSFLTAGQRVKAWEKDFTPALEAIRDADLLIFCYPVYTFLVPSQLHRFIELMKESGEDFSDKVATQLTTSKHFYDITAHRFVEDNCADMHIPFIEGLSADMDDLLTEKGRKEAEEWMRLVLWNAGKQYYHINNRIGTAMATASMPATVPPSVTKTDTMRAVIVTDCTPDDSELQLMIARFRARLPYECDVVNILDFPFKGGCISCFNCSTSGKCFYKDGFDDFLRNNIHRHDAILYAFRVKDHSMGYRFKVYDDRQFCNGHRTVTMGTPFGYLVAGDMQREENLRLVLEARAEVGGNFLAGIADDSKDTDARIDQLAATIAYAMEHRYTRPQNFLGVGGMKIFRDLIWQMRGLMRADHRFFKSHGQYDFPQKKWATSLKIYLVGWLMNNKKLKAKMGNKMNEGMIKPYRQVLENEKKQHPPLSNQ